MSIDISERKEYFTQFLLFATKQLLTGEYSDALDGGCLVKINPLFASKAMPCWAEGAAGLASA